MKTKHYALNSGSLIIINRIDRTPNQILGFGSVFNSKLQSLFTFCSLELPFNENLQSKSAIPTGTYLCEKRIHNKFGKCFYIHNVFGRVGIYIHVGNIVSHTRGCPLVGAAFSDINKDGLLDVVSSRHTIDLLYDCAIKMSQLRIV